jgi:tRNA1(Val) A37 N6-methylase TrmN6
VDTLLLASFAASGRPRARRVVDLGSGTGALGLSYAFLATTSRIDFVEREETLVTLANRNLAETRWVGAVHQADLETRGLPRELSGCADLVLSNPPFFETGTARSGRSPTDSARRGPLGPFLRAANAALGRRAAACFAYPSAALAEFFARASDLRLVPKRLRLVHAFSTSSSRLALVELRRAKPGGLVVEPPLVEWAARGVRSDELDALVSGKR